MQFSFACMLCISHAVLTTKPNDELAEKEQENYIFPPKNQFCLFTSGEFVFEDKLKKVAPSAKLEGVGTLQNVHARGTKCDASKPRCLWGAIYYISNDDKATLEEFAFEERLTIADVRIKKSGCCDSIVDCVSMDVGVLPHAFPICMYKEFSREICVKDYLKRLAEIEVSQDYIDWLETLPANKKDGTPPDYVVTPCFYAPPAQRCPPPSIDERMLQIQEEKIPDDKVCVFVTGDLIFEKAMTSIVPSATVVGAAMLADEYIGLGCPFDVEPPKYMKYKGFRNIWGVSYTIDKNDLDKFTEHGEKYHFMSEVRIILKEMYQATCKTVDVGLLPSGFPFEVYKVNKLDIDSYSQRLKDLGVPAGYVDGVIQLGYAVDRYEEAAKSPVQYVLNDQEINMVPQNMLPQITN